MPPSLKKLGIDKLSVEDRLALVEEIWNSIAATPDQLSLTDAQKQELDRRLADDDANPDGAVPWEAVKAETQARSRR